MPAPPVQPIVIWFGRVGDLILLSALLEILHRGFGSPCHVIGAGAWRAELYAAHADVARVSCLHRYTAWAFDPTWWRTRRSLRASRAGPVYVCETDPRKLARIRRLLRFSGIEAARCVFLAREKYAARRFDAAEAQQAPDSCQLARIGLADIDRAGAPGAPGAQRAPRAPPGRVEYPGGVAMQARHARHVAVRRVDLSRSEEHTSELQSQSNLVCRLLLEKKKKKYETMLLWT